MMCYKDKTFCTYYNCVNASPAKCSRTLTRDIKDEADKFGLPVCVFAAKPECFIQDLDYQEGY